MDLLLVVSLLFLVFYGFITSYEDYKYGKIRNIWVLASVLYGVFVLIFSVSYLYFTNIRFNWEYILEFSLNILFALLSGVIMWICGLWSAGDAKLFFGYAAIIPINVYNWGYILGFPSFVILINTFVPLFVYYLFSILKNTSFKEKIDIIKEMLNIKFILKNSLFIFAFIWVIKMILSTKMMARYGSNIFTVVALLFLFLLLFEHLLKIDILVISLILSVLYLIDSYKEILTLHFAWYFLSIFILFIFLRYFIINLGYTFLSKEVDIEDLKPGMIPLENIIIKSGRYFKKKIEHTSFLSGLLDKLGDQRLFHNVSDGLSEDEVKKIQKMHSHGEFKNDSIKIGQVVPFAHFMFIGVILTIIFKGNFIISLFKIMFG